MGDKRRKMHEGMIGGGNLPGKESNSLRLIGGWNRLLDA